MKMAGLVLGSICKIYKHPEGKEYNYERKKYHYCKQYPVSSIGGIRIGGDMTKEVVDAMKNTFIEHLVKNFDDDTLSFIKDIAEGPIGLDIPHPDRAIIITGGNQTWCLDGVLEQMRVSNNGSHGRGTLNISLFGRNLILNNIIEKLKKDKKRKVMTKCTDHNKYFVYFCEDCKTFVCYDGVPLHKRHSFIKLDEKYPKITSKIQEETQELRKNLEFTNSKTQDVSKRVKISKEILMSELEPSLSMISTYSTKFHKESWGWFNNFSSELAKIKEYERTKGDESQALIDQNSVANICDLYKEQKTLEGFNKDIRTYQKYYERLSESKTFSNSSYTFEFNMKLPGENNVIVAISDGLSGQLSIQGEQGTIELSEVQRDTEPKQAKEQNSGSMEDSKEESKEEQIVTEIEVNDKPLDKEHVENQEPEDKQEAFGQKFQQLIVFQKKELDLLGDSQKLTSTYKFLFIAKMNSPTEINLIPFIDEKSENLNMKLVMHQYSKELISHLISSLTCLSSCYQDCLNTTSESLNALTSSILSPDSDA